MILSTHNVTLTKAIEDRVINRLEKLDHFDQRAIDARVTLDHRHSSTPEKQFVCSLRLRVRGPDLFAEDVQSDMYAAIDGVAKKIEQQIRKRHEKRLVKKRKIPARSKQKRLETAE